jgi:hypothetical protein
LISFSDAAVSNISFLKEAPAASFGVKTSVRNGKGPLYDQFV